MVLLDGRLDVELHIAFKTRAHGDDTLHVFDRANGCKFEISLIFLVLFVYLVLFFLTMQERSQKPLGLAH